METAATPEAPEVPRHIPYRLFTSLLSGLCPGLGQWFLGVTRKAILMFGCFVLVVTSAIALRIPGSYPGFLGFIWCLAILCTWSAVSALRVASNRAAAVSRWWTTAALLFAATGFTVHSNWALRAAGFRNFSLPSTSMQPTMLVGDKFIVDFRGYRDKPPIAGEIRVYERDGTYFVKRVIAVEGDIIASKGGLVSVNGKELQEAYAHHKDGSYPPEWANNFGPIRVPTGKLFVMGDNRDVSLDSRSEQVGFVDLKEVAGKPLYNYRPIDDRVGKHIQ